MVWPRDDPRIKGFSPTSIPVPSRVDLKIPATLPLRVPRSPKVILLTDDRRSDAHWPATVRKCAID
jgi:hypothetical protein